MPFVIPSAGVGSEGLVLDGLDLAQGPTGAIMLHAFSPPMFAKRKEWIEAADADGAILARDPLISVGDAAVTVAIPGVDRDDALAAIGTIVDKLEEADRNPGGIPLVWTPSGGSVSGTAYVLTGEVTELPVDWESGWMAYMAMVTFTLSCKPGWYLDPVVYTGSATAGPLVTLEIGSVPGDAPADATLSVAEGSSQNRRTVEWGAEWRYYDPSSPWSLVLDSDNLVTTGFAGTQTTLAGAYDPGASGNAIIATTIATSYQGICGTGVQPHVGTFRVKARINTGSGGVTDMSIRFAWRAGDGSYTSNDPVTFTDSIQEFLEIDLGLITITPTTSGAQEWDGRVEAVVATGSETVYVDYVMLIPVEAGYGKATAAYSYSPGVISSRDSFTGTTAGVALNGRTADVGGTWATSGAATDLAFADALGGEQITRNATGLRYAILGASTFTNVEVAATLEHSGTSSSSVAQGVICRWTDSSNYLVATLSQSTGFTGTTTSLAVTQVVAGVATSLGSTTLPTFSSGDISLVAFTSGRVIAQFGRSYTVDANSSAVATGGALATGTAGIYDSGPTAITRYYDDFYVSVPPAEPIVMYSGRILEIRHDSVERQNTSASTWGRPQSYRGSRFKVPPAGDANRTTRVAVKASRNDLTVAEDANLTDQIQLTATVTPRCTVIPRV